MIKVLHLFTTLDGGGVESFLYNYYSHMDNNKIVFDAVVPGMETGYLEQYFTERGSKVYHIKRFRENPFKYWFSIAGIVKNGHYDIIHCHGYKSAIGIFFGKIYGCNNRIIHSHMAHVRETKIQKINRKFLGFVAKKLSTDWFACGIDAAKWFFGEKAYDKGQVSIIDNAIDLSKYKFDINSREKIRKELGVENDFVVGNIGRLTYQKNQIFLIDVMKELLEENPNSKLVLIGDGEDREKLTKYSKTLNISKQVIFLGMRKDIPELLCALDFFVLPSYYEGLPVVLAEVQASGLKGCVSDTVTQEVNVTSNLHYLSFKDPTFYWAKKISSIFDSSTTDRSIANSSMRNGKYDILSQSDELFERYRTMTIKK